MVYKGIIFDLDGTAVPNRSDGVPSARLIKVVNSIKDKVKIGFATGRTIGNCRHIIKMLNLDTPCIIVGGTKIIDPITEKTIWEKQMSIEQVNNIVTALVDYKYPIIFEDEEIRYFHSMGEIVRPENIIYIQRIEKQDLEPMQKKLQSVTGVTGHIVPSWTKHLYEIHITHKAATKQHSVRLWLEMLDLKSEEVIGFGDGENDLPIFEAVGCKVAMADAADKLKTRADIITDTADENGVAKILEKFFINQ